MIANLSYFVSVAFIRNANFVSDKPVVTFVLLPFTGADKLTATTGSSKKQFAGAFFCDKPGQASCNGCFGCLTASYSLTTAIALGKKRPPDVFCSASPYVLSVYTAVAN